MPAVDITSALYVSYVHYFSTLYILAMYITSPLCIY